MRVSLSRAFLERQKHGCRAFWPVHGWRPARGDAVTSIEPKLRSRIQAGHRVLAARLALWILE